MEHIEIRCLDNIDFETRLTIGKVYRINKPQYYRIGNLVTIRDDIDAGVYKSDRFIEVIKYRNLIISNILE